MGRKGPHEINIDLTEQENPGVAVDVNSLCAGFGLTPNGLAIADTGRKVTKINGVLIPTSKRYLLKADDILQFGKTEVQIKVSPKQKTGIKK